MSGPVFRAPEVKIYGPRFAPGMGNLISAAFVPLPLCGSLPSRAVLIGWPNSSIFALMAFLSRFCFRRIRQSMNSVKIEMLPLIANIQFVDRLENCPTKAQIKKQRTATASVQPDPIVANTLKNLGEETLMQTDLSRVTNIYYQRPKDQMISEPQTPRADGAEINTDEPHAIESNQFTHNIFHSTERVAVANGVCSLLNTAHLLVGSRGIMLLL